MVASTPDLPGLVFWGEASLMEPQPAVSAEDIAADDWSDRLDTLARCMDAYGGIGIAAPQVGWAARVFCLGISGVNDRYPDAEAFPLQFWVNPVIDTSSGSCWAWEGCLSVPGLRGWVSRPAEIEVSGLNAHGEPAAARLEGFAARVFQHELDHLDGVLMPTRITDPRFLLSDALLAKRDSWQPHWPSPGAFSTQPGRTSLER
ncbi:MAG: peptide deformylase [Pseudomonadota bacterium]